MANIKISELNPLLTVEDADVLPIVDNAVTKKVTAAILRTYTEGNSVLLTGAQTIAGIKTFTSQLASTVATGTAPFSVASTTKVTNLNADLLDGLSSADFALSTRTLTAGTGLTGGGDLTANRTFAIDSTVTTLTGTQTLTNKTLTSPIINEVLDSNGNEILGFTPIASATDYITIKNGIGVGVPVHISATGSSANTGIHIEPKGSGLVQISDGTDTTKGIRFRSSGSATSAVTLIDAVSSAGRVITLPNATGTLALTSDLTAYVPTTRTVSTTSPIIGGGALSSDLTLSIPQASGSVNGYLSSTDFATFNAKQNAITLTTTGTSGAATLVGSTLNIPNYADTDTGITSLNGLTALTQTFATGTSGTDFAISSATSTHTFNLPTASAANRGALSSADWTTFNNKQNALTNPITGTGTTNYLPKFTGASALGNSVIYDSGTNIGIGTPTPASILQVEGANYSFIAGSDAGNRRVLIGLDSVGEPSIQGTLSNGTARQLSINPLGGNVGIGTTSPATILGVAGDITLQLSGAAIRDINNNALLSVQSSNELWLGGGGGGFSTIFYAGAAERMRLTSAGNVGIGTTTPATLLHSSKTYSAPTGGIDSNIQILASNTSSASGLGLLASNSSVSFLHFGDTDSANIGQIAYTHANDNMLFVANGAERMRIASNGNTLIGTTTDAGYKLDVNGTARIQGQLAVNHSLSGNYGAIVYNTSATGEGLVVRGGSTASHTSFAVQPYDGSVALFSVVASGAATFSSSVTTAAGLALSAATAPASGIEFPATQVASASANNLDDYEEGTWTMGIAFGGGSTGVTYSNNSGTYTKIGRQVTVNGFVKLSSKGSSTGDATITGLPFTIGSSSANYSAPSFAFSTITFLNQFQGEAGIGETKILLQEVSSLGSLSAITDADFANTSYIIISFTYFV